MWVLMMSATKINNKLEMKPIINFELLLGMWVPVLHVNDDQMRLNLYGPPIMMNQIGCTFKGSQGSEHPRMFWSHFDPPDFRVLSGINRFLITENRF